jgi:fused signal recognition particle receptor
MWALSNKLPTSPSMATFFRRKKPDAPAERRYSTAELAAAFPTPRPAAPAASEPASPAPVTPPAVIVPVASPAVAAPRPAAAPSAPTDVLPEAQPPQAQAEDLVRDEAEIVADATTPEVLSPFQTGPGQAHAAQFPSERADGPADIAIPPAADTALPAAVGKAGWRERLRGSGFARSIGSLFARNPKLDDDLLDEIETALLVADVGVGATTALVDDLRKRMKAREFADARALFAALRGDLIAILQPVARPLQIDVNAKPFVVLTVGVNGVGKTTTIGKLARRFRDENRSLMLAAGDTFRAAAVAQLQAWGDRNGVPVVAQGQNADAASVAFDALQAAKARGIEVLIADTAGRLHTQHGLMAELGKIKRVLGKVDPTAPHEVLMVIDGTTGQNALSQLRQFHAAVGVTGLVVTKLDGSAKGGVVFALAREFGIPIRFAGIGERPEDLRVFDAEAFVDALLPETLGA